MTTTTPKKEYHETHTITGKVYWAKVQKPDDNGKYSLEMSLDKKSKKLIEELGIPVKLSKTDPSRPEFVAMDRYAFDFDGNPKSMPVVDSKGNPIDHLIGNESLGKVEFFAKEWSYPRVRPTKNGVKAYMLKLQILELVPFESKGNESKIQAEDEGYVVPSSETNRFAKG